MQEYQIRLSREAEKVLARIVLSERLRIQRAIDSLATNPRLTGARQLVGSDGLYRLKVGQYRAVYDIQDDVLLILIITVGHRRDVYRRY